MKIALINNGPDTIRGCQGIRLAWEQLLQQKYENVEYIRLNPYNEITTQPDKIITIGGDTPSWLNSSSHAWQLYYSKTSEIPTYGGGLCFSAKDTYDMISDRRLFPKYAHLQALSVRDTRSYDQCRYFGLSPILCKDPAYILTPETPSNANITDFLSDGTAVGINLMHIDSKQLPIWKEFIQDLLSDSRKVILIPGKFPEDNQKFREMGLSHENLYTIKELITYPEIKYIAAHCATLIASSSHVAMAGYAGTTPTLALAYNAKAFAMDEDIFGPLNSCCIANTDIKDKGDIQATFSSLVEREDSISTTLSQQNFSESAAENIQILDE